IFDENRYFDVFVEYAKGSAEDILIQITVHNRGPEAAQLDVLPTLWFRNTWYPDITPGNAQLQGMPGAVLARHPALGDRYFYFDGDAQLLFTENETNTERIFGTPNAAPYVKDGINNFVVHGQKDAINPAQTGTKVSAQYRLTVPGGGSQVLRLR